MLPSIAFLLLILPGCSGSTQHGQSFKLPAGHVIRVIGIMPLHYMNGNPPSLMFQYETDLLVSDKNELIKEVDEIWSVLRSAHSCQTLAGPFHIETSGKVDFHSYSAVA